VDRINWKSTAHNEPRPRSAGRDIGAAGSDLGSTLHQWPWRLPSSIISPRSLQWNRVYTRLHAANRSPCSTWKCRVSVPDILDRIAFRATPAASTCERLTRSTPAPLMRLGLRLPVWSIRRLRRRNRIRRAGIGRRIGNRPGRGKRLRLRLWWHWLRVRH